MATFSQAFRPAQNKEGLSRLEFLGYEMKEGKSEKTGKPYAFLNLNFRVKGAVRGTDRIISVTANFTYAPDNLLGRTLAAMGFDAPEVELEVDEEGFEIEALGDTDDEGFEDEPANDLGIEDFLASAQGNVYTAKVDKVTEGKRKGFWVIDVDTIKLFKTAE